jgi:hypothetical protein
MRKPMRLLDTYRFPGFRPAATVRGIFGDPKARIVSLRRLRKNRSVVPVAQRSAPSPTASGVASATCRVATRARSWKSRSEAWTATGFATDSPKTVSW